METRSDEKAQKLADELELKGLIDYFTQNRMPKDDQKDKREVMKEDIEKIFNEKNNQQKINLIAGNNNTVIVLNNTSFIILLSEMRQTAANLTKTFSATGAAPSWLPKEFQVQSITESKHYTREDKKFRAIYDSSFNHLPEGQLAGNFLSVSATEYFSNSLDRMVKQSMTDNERINLACDMGQQICGVLADIKNKQYLWSDLKAGNIMLRSDNSIGIPDKKGFWAYEDVLVKKYEMPYAKESIPKHADFPDEDKTLDNKFYYKFPETTTADFEFRVKNIKGEIIKGSISNEVLRSKFESDEEYNTFRVKLNERKSPNDDEMNKIYEASNELYKTLTTAYTVDYETLTFTKAFCSDEFQREKRYSVASLARAGFIDSIQMEYSYQLAAVLYTTLTGDENKFFMRPLDFSQSVFQSPDGEKLRSLIENLSQDDPSKRISYKQAVNELNQIRMPIERKVEVQAETVKKSTSGRMVRAISKAAMPKFLHSGELKKTDPVSEKSVSFTPESAKRTQSENMYKNIEKGAGVKPGAPLNQEFKKPNTILRTSQKRQGTEEPDTTLSNSQKMRK